MSLAQGHNTVLLCGSNPGPLDSESDALPLRHRATDVNIFSFKWDIRETLLQTQALFYFMFNHDENLHA